MMAAADHIMIIAVATLIGCAITGVGAYSYTSIVNLICNGESYFELSGNYNAPGVLTGLIVRDLPNQPNFDWYYQVKNDNNYVLYGHGSCSRTLGRDRCATCITSAREQLFLNCSSHRIGAQIELQGCKLRYEEYKF